MELWSLGSTVLSNVVDVLTLLTIAAGWYYVLYGRGRRERNWLRQTAKQPGNRPAVLIVSLLEDLDITADVRHFIAASPALSSAFAGLSDQQPERIFTVIQGKGPLCREDMPELARAFRAKYGEIAGSGFDVLHVFYAGPVVAAMTLGAVLANRGDIRLYYKARRPIPGTNAVDSAVFEEWGSLNY